MLDVMIGEDFSWQLLADLKGDGRHCEYSDRGRVDRG